MREIEAQKYRDRQVNKPRELQKRRYEGQGERGNVIYRGRERKSQNSASTP